MKRDEAITDISILAKAKDEADAADKKAAAEKAASAARESAREAARAADAEDIDVPEELAEDNDSDAAEAAPVE
jgi:hypothetical protein